MPKLSLALLAGFLLLAAGAQAQAPVTRIRGTVEKLDGQMLTVTTREGPSATIKLADNVVVNAVSATPLSAVAANSYIGAAGIKQADGSYVAQEVLVFPETARGTGEGIYPWDLTPDSTMLNATVATVTEAPKGRTLTVAAKGETAHVMVPEGVPVVTFAPADRALLVPGAKVFMGAQKAVDGSFSAARVLVGKDGMTPPM